MIHALVRKIRYEHVSDLGPFHPVAPPAGGFILVLEIEHPIKPDLKGGGGMDALLLLELVRAAEDYVAEEGLGALVKYVKLTEYQCFNKIEGRIKAMENMLFPADPRYVEDMGII